MTDKIVVFSTCADETQAGQLASVLVEARLAACVNIVPHVRSIYRWQGAVEQSDECLLVIKSSRALFEELRRELNAAHSYELPEAIAIPIVEGSAPYLEWIGQNLRSVTQE
jgi:periplasmic divalent cation tolerance protein